MTSHLQVPKKFKPLWTEEKRYYFLSGSRGSSKSWSVADHIIVTMAQNQNLNVACMRQVQKSIKYSSKKLLEDTIRKLGLQDYFDIIQTEIRAKKGAGVIIFNGLQDHTVDSIKSLESFDICWVEESHNITRKSLEILAPTFRKDNAKLIFTWNPQTPKDAIEEFAKTKGNSVKIFSTYLDNPFCPKSIKEEAEEMEGLNYPLYKHVYLGGYIEADEKALIQRKWLKACTGADKYFKRTKGVRLGGYDVADAGDDTNALALRDGNKLFYLDQWHGKKDEMFISSKKVARKAEVLNIDIVNYDNVGVGAGVGSNFNQIGVNFKHTAFTANAKPTDESYKDDKTNREAFGNLISQAWQKVADMALNTYRYLEKGEDVDLEECLIIDENLDNLDDLINELTSRHFKEDRAGRMILESKEELKKRGYKSPNLADAVCMSFVEIPDEDELKIWDY